MSVGNVVDFATWAALLCSPARGFGKTPLPVNCWVFCTTSQATDHCVDLFNACRPQNQQQQQPEAERGESRGSLRSTATSACCPCLLPTSLMKLKRGGLNMQQLAAAQPQQPWLKPSDQVQNRNRPLIAPLLMQVAVAPCSGFHQACWLPSPTCKDLVHLLFIGGISLCHNGHHAFNLSSAVIMSLISQHIPMCRKQGAAQACSTQRFWL